MFISYALTTSSSSELVSDELSSLDEASELDESNKKSNKKQKSTVIIIITMITNVQ